jgi:caffeoyl-CoA O-methyltransferase
MLNLDPNLEQYILDHTDPEGNVLEDLNRYTHVNILNPNMLSGHLQGKILEIISRMVRPARILEIGTYTGYSAICLAKGLQEGGELITIDLNDELSEINNSYFQKAGLENRIKLLNGDALTLIPDLPGPFDLVYIDGEKTEYVAYYRVVFDKVRPGGYLLADNVLWGGKILDPESEMDESTKDILAFNELVTKDPRVINVLLPVRDGLMIMQKKEGMNIE